MKTIAFLSAGMNIMPPFDKYTTVSTYEFDIRVHPRSEPRYQSSVAMMTITSDDQISSFFAIA